MQPWPARPTDAQLDRLQAELREVQRRLNALTHRLDQLACPPDRQLYREAHNARAAVQALVVALHYETAPGCPRQ